MFPFWIVKSRSAILRRIFRRSQSHHRSNCRSSARRFRNSERNFIVHLQRKLEITDGKRCRWVPCFVGALELCGNDGKKRLCQRRSEEHTSELQSRENLVCRLLL